MINKIKTEAFQNSHVMESAFYLTDVYGPRLDRFSRFASRRRLGRSHHERLGNVSNPST